MTGLEERRINKDKFVYLLSCSSSYTQAIARNRAGVLLSYNENSSITNGDDNVINNGDHYRVEELQRQHAVYLATGPSSSATKASAVSQTNQTQVPRH